MKLVPFFLSKKERNHFTITNLHLFLSHAGKSIWKTDEPGSLPLQSVLEDYCEPNGFVIKRTYVDTSKHIVYLEIDSEKTNLTDFYTWEEALSKPTKPECWRRFIFVKDAEQADWWSPKDLIEAEIQDYGNVWELYCFLCSTFPDK